MDWDPHFLSRSPMFEPLRLHAPAFGPAWPALADWGRAFERRDPPAKNAAGAILRAVAPGRRPGAVGRRYEARLYAEAELEMRPASWHDCFNALAWLAFPQAKAALNARHYAALEAQHAAGRANRGPVQDALTLFDEGGVAVISCDAALLRLVREFAWKELFWRRRRALEERACVLVFGHALHEKALAPFLGVTGRAILIQLDEAWLAQPLAERVADADARLAGIISDPSRLRTTGDLEVLPVFGMPGWFAGNDREGFYDNQDYFRPGRARGGGE